MAVQHQSVAFGFPTESADPTGLANHNATLLPTLGTAGRAIYEMANTCSNPEDLDKIGRLLWRGYGEGRLDDSEATHLQSIINGDKPADLTVQQPVKFRLVVNSIEYRIE